MDFCRGMNINVLVVDEAAFIEHEEFWTSLVPVLSFNGARIFLASTQNGKTHKNGKTKWFYQAYLRAKNDIKNWKVEKLKWWQIPNRDMQWKKETVRMIGKDAFKREFGTDFID